MTWLERASDLLREPDPGPQPWLVEGLLVDRGLGAIVGPPKVGKTWLLLELAVAIATGRDTLEHTVPQPWPVIVVLEESGRAALHRRLDALARGHATTPDQLEHLHFAANKRVRLDDPGWQNEIIVAAIELKARAVFFDPLARLKSPGRDENAQKEMAPVLEYLRDLRDNTGAAAVFVHHSGHNGEHLRGSSDLESWWESKITVKASQKLYAEHREAEATDEFGYRVTYDHTTRTVRLVRVDAEGRNLRADVAAYLERNPDASANTVASEVDGRRTEILTLVRELKGGSRPGRSRTARRTLCRRRPAMTAYRGGYPQRFADPGSGHPRPFSRGTRLAER
jgi:hypothetical protein